MFTFEPLDVAGLQGPGREHIVPHSREGVVAPRDRILEAERVDAQPPPIIGTVVEELREELGNMPVEDGRNRSEELEEPPTERVVVSARVLVRTTRQALLRDRAQPWAGIRPIHAPRRTMSGD